MPESDDLLQLFQDTRKQYDALKIEFAEDERLITGDYGAEFIPDDWSDEGLQDPVISSTAYDAVENSANHILTSPRIFVPPRPVKDSVEAGQERAERIRVFLELFYRRVEEDQGAPIDHARKPLIKGRSVLKRTINWDILPDPPASDADPNTKRRWRRDFEKAGREHCLWNVESLPALIVYEDPDKPWDPNYVFEAREILAQDASRMFPEDADLKKMDPTTRVKHIEYYSKPSKDDPGKHVQWIEDERKVDQVNPYSWLDDLGNYTGYVPYYISDPDWGWSTKTDRIAPPEDRYVGLLRPLRSMIISKDRQTTAIEAWLRMHVWPFMKGKNLDEDEDDLEFGPGKWKNFTEEQDLEFMAAGEAPVTVFQYLDRMAQELDRSTKFGALGGTAQPGVDTATEADLNIRNATTKLSGPVGALRRVMQRMNQHTLQDIAHVLEVPITIYAATRTGTSEITLLPKEVRGYYHTFVELTTSDESALEARNARLWADLSQILGVSQKTAMEKAGIPNPQEEMDEAAVERITNNPAMEQARLLMALTGMGETQVVSGTVLVIVTDGHILSYTLVNWSAAVFPLPAVSCATSAAISAVTVP